MGKLSTLDWRRFRKERGGGGGGGGGGRRKQRSDKILLIRWVGTLADATAVLKLRSYNMRLGFKKIVQ